MKSRVTVDMTELQARENRELNLIFFNVPESDSVDADIRKDDDKSTVQEALHDIGIETAMVTDFQRLGKPDPSTDNLEKKKTPTEINPRVAGRKKCSNEKCPQTEREQEGACEKPKNQKRHDPTWKRRRLSAFQRMAGKKGHIEASGYGGTARSSILANTLRNSMPQWTHKNGKTPDVLTGNRPNRAPAGWHVSSQNRTTIAVEVHRRGYTCPRKRSKQIAYPQRAGRPIYEITRDINAMFLSCSVALTLYIHKCWSVFK